MYSERSNCAMGQYYEHCSLAAFSLPEHWTPFCTDEHSVYEALIPFHFLLV